MEKISGRESAMAWVLLLMTAVTGVVDAVSVLALGHVFSANMTGNIIFLGLAIGGAPGISVSRSLLALVCFAIGAAIGGNMTKAIHSSRWTTCALGAEVVLLLAAAAVSRGMQRPYEEQSVTVHGVIAITAIAMGLRNAVIRKVAIPDLTTTVLTLTITGLASESSFAGGENPRWQRRLAAVATMLAGAAAGAWMLRVSVALPLLVSGLLAGIFSLVSFQLHAKGESQ